MVFDRRCGFSVQCEVLSKLERGGCGLLMKDLAQELQIEIDLDRLELSRKLLALESSSCLLRIAIVSNKTLVPLGTTEITAIDRLIDRIALREKILDSLKK